VRRYATLGRHRDTSNATDGIYANGGAHSTLELRKRHQGYRGRIVLGVDT